MAIQDREKDPDKNFRRIIQLLNIIRGKDKMIQTLEAEIRHKDARIIELTRQAELRHNKEDKDVKQNAKMEN